MKCSVCEGDLAWGEGVSQRGHGVRHDTCFVEKKRKSSSQGSSGSSQGAQGKSEKIMTAMKSAAVRVTIEGEQGSSWFGRNEMEALANARSSMARKYGKDYHTFVEFEGEEHE